MSLVKKSFFKNEDREKYIKCQKIATLTKINKHRNQKEYNQVSAEISSFVSLSHKNMICLGARNPWEKKCFQKNFPNLNVKDLDLSPESCCDHIMDYSKLPEDWQDYWDIIYSNAPDHALDGEQTIKEWFRALKPNGILAIGWATDNLFEEGSKKWFSEHDCILYNNFEEIGLWIENDLNGKILHNFGPMSKNKIDTSFNYYIIKKL